MVSHGGWMSKEKITIIMEAGNNNPSNALLSDALASCRGGFLAVVLFSMCINILMLTSPLFMMQAYDRVLTSRKEETLVLLLVIAGVALLTMAVLVAVRGYILQKTGNWLDLKLSGFLLAGSVAETVGSGKSPSIQGLRDLGTVRGFLSGNGVIPIMDAPWTPIYLGSIFLLHPTLGWFSLAGALVLFSLAIANELATRKPQKAAGVASIMALNQAESAVRNADVITAMGMIDNLVLRWRRRNAMALKQQALAGNRGNTISSLSKFLRIALQTGILGLGAWLAISDQMSPGGMIAASILMGRALQPVEQAIGTWKSMIAARSAYGRVKALLAKVPVALQTMPLSPPKGALEVKEIGYFPPGWSEPLLRNVTFRLEPGQAMGIIGSTATGKTTLARLLVGNLTPRTGQIRLDGADMSNWDARDRGQYLGYLPQDIELFEGTVDENIARLGAVDPPQVEEAAKMAGVDDLIKRIPGGYDAQVGVAGHALSGGQRQRIALARAVFNGPHLVILDEPNANLDGHGEKALAETIERLKSDGAMVILIAHREAVLEQTDRILFMRAAGEPPLFGPKDEVLAKVLGRPKPVPAQQSPVAARTIMPGRRSI